MLSQSSALSYVQTPRLRATLIEFYDVATSGATDLTIKSVPKQFMSFNDMNGNSIYQPIRCINVSVSDIYDLLNV